MEEGTKQINKQEKTLTDTTSQDSEWVNIDKILSESKGVGYYRRYGMHFAVAVILLGIFFCLITYFSLQEKFSYYRNALETVYNEDGEQVTVPVWDSVKCKPHILPISGYIKRNPNETSSTASLRYMRECIKVDTGSLVALNPVTAASATVSATLNTFSSVLTSLRDNVERLLLSMVRNSKQVNRTTALHRYNIIEEIQLSIDKRIVDSVIELEKHINGSSKTGISLEKAVKDKEERRRRAEELKREKERLRIERERAKAASNTSPTVKEEDTNFFSNISSLIGNSVIF